MVCPRWDSNYIPALQTLDARGNMRNPKQFEGSTTQSEAESVDNVHSRISTLGGHG